MAETETSQFMARLLNEREAAQILNVVPGTLAEWRRLRRMPLRFIKIGRHVKYSVADIERFIALRTRPGDSSDIVPRRRRRVASK
jgi:hypothetical protein